MNAQKLNRTFTQLGFASTWGYIFFSVVPHAAAGKYISSALMLLSFLLLLARKQIRKPQFTWLNVSIFLVVGLALLSAALTPYAADSLNQFRKEGLPFLLGFLLLTSASMADRNKTVVYTLLSLMFGYAVKEILALWAGAANSFQFSIYESPDTTLPKYLDFFSADTPYYLPFLLGPLLFWPMNFWQKGILLILSILAMVVVIFSGVRTAFIFVVVTIFLILIYRFWNTKKLLILMLSTLTLCGYLLMHQTRNPSIARYSSITTTQTYQFGKDGSVSERYAIIKGVWEVSKDRLLLGYGPGWKKLPTVAEVNGHMDRWRQSSNPVDGWIFRYFSLGVGRVNPHNFYIELVFENGLLGLIAYLSLMLAAGVGILKLLMRSTDAIQKGVAVSGALYLMVYLGGSIAGGAWLPVTMLVIVVCLAQYQRKSLQLVS